MSAKVTDGSDGSASFAENLVANQKEDLMRIGKIAMGSYMVNMAHGLKPDELKSPEKTKMAKGWLKTAEKEEGKVTAEKCDNKPENITFRTEDWLDRTWTEAKKTNSEETAQPEDPSKGKLNITHIPGNFSFGPRITEQWVAVGSTDKYDPATKTGIIEIGFRGTVTLINAWIDSATVMAPIGTVMFPQLGDSLFSPTMRYWRGHPLCAFIPYLSCCPNACQDVCAINGCPCCFMENDYFQYPDWTYGYFYNQFGAAGAKTMIHAGMFNGAITATPAAEKWLNDLTGVDNTSKLDNCTNCCIYANPCGWGVAFCIKMLNLPTAAVKNVSCLYQTYCGAATLAAGHCCATPCWVCSGFTACKDNKCYNFLPCIGSFWGRCTTVRKPANDTKMTVRVTGHSLGGSIATIFALKLAMMGYNVELVTFGSPRVGNKYFSEITTKALDGRIARFENPGDVIPEVPYEWIGYKHVGEAYKIDGALLDNKITTSTNEEDKGTKQHSKNMCCFCCPFGEPFDAPVQRTAGEFAYEKDKCCIKLGKHVAKGAQGGHGLNKHMFNLQKIADCKTPGGAPMPNMMERGLAAVNQVIDTVTQ